MHCQDSFIFQQSFNPRTREGATQAITSLNYGPQSFNPRTREGATLLMWFGLVPKQSFNPRTREGATGEVRWINNPDMFQSTHP